MRHTHKNPDILFKVLANKTRRSILLNLARQDLSLSFLAHMYDMSFPGMTKHLSKLKAAGLVRSYHIGYFAMYRLSSPTILKLIEDITIWYNNDKSA